MNNIKNAPMKKVMKGAGLIMLGIFMSKILGYVYRVIVARTGTEPYGLLSLGLALFGIIVTFSLLGLGTGVLRYVSYYKSRKDISNIKSTILSVLKISLPLSIIFSALVFIFSGWLAQNIFHNTDLKWIFRIIAVSAPFDVLGIILFQVNRAFQIVKYEVIIKYVGENILKIISLILFLFLGMKLLGPALAYTIGVIFSGTLAFFITRKKIFNFSDKKIKYQPIYKKIMSFSWPLLFTHFLFMIILWADTIMLGYFRTASEVGIYNVAMPTAHMLYVIPYAFSFLFMPVLTDLYARKKWPLFHNLYCSTSRWIFVINLFPLAVFLFLSSYVIHTLFGFDYTASILPLIILSVGYFISYVNITSNNLLVVFKKTKLIFFDILIVTALNIFLNLFLIPVYGVNGAAIATSISFFLLGTLYFIQVKIITRYKILDFSYFKIISACASAVLAMFFIKKFIYFDKAVFSLASNTLILFLLYIFFLIIFKVFNKEDKELFNVVKQKILRMVR